jgi:hypothetical protein
MKGVSNVGVTDIDILVASVGHDLLEDCKVTREELVLLFGESSTSMIEECTRLGGDHVGKKEKLDFLKSFKDKSVGSIIIKILDRQKNVYDYLSTAGKEKYACKYALQAVPLFTAFFDRMLEFEPYCDVSLLAAIVVDLQDNIAFSLPRHKKALKRGGIDMSVVEDILL